MATLDWQGHLIAADTGGTSVMFPFDSTIDCAEKFHFVQSYIIAQTNAAIDFGSVSVATVLLIRVSGDFLLSPTFKINGSATEYTVNSGGTLLIFNGMVTSLTFSWSAVGGGTLVLEVYGGGA